MTSGEQVSRFPLATGHSSLVTTFQLRGLESNQRPPGSEPGVTTSSNCPGIRGEGVEPSSPGSRPGSLPLADPRDSGRRGSRTLKAHRSAVFGTAAVACRLVLPFRAAVAGIEPALVSLTGSRLTIRLHRTKVRTVGFEPTLSGSRNRRIPRLSYVLNRAPSGS